MLRLEFDYALFAMVRMTGHDLGQLLNYSLSHYDGRCQAAGRVGGFLYGFINQWMMASDVCYPAIGDLSEVPEPDLNREEVFRISTDQLDTLAKICENNDSLKLGFFTRTLRECAEEYRRLCPHPHTVEEDKLEQELKRLMKACDRNSGLPAYPNLDRQRKDILRQIEEKRTLTRWEFINLHGYEQWRSWTDEHGLPENHPKAEVPK